MRKVFLVLLLVAMPAFAWADEYVLVMSKEDNVCQQMLKIYNADLKKYGEVKYDEHEEFTAIKWEGKKYYTTYPDGKKHYDNDGNKVFMSKFDINNDGKEEVVVKNTAPVRDRPSESLYYFKNEDANYFKDEEVDIKMVYDKAIGAAGTTGASEAFKGNSYALKELPKIPIGIISGKEAYSHYSLAGWFFIHPFRFTGGYYIDMWDDDPFGGRGFLVISKYTKENKLKDICYYLKVSDTKTKTQRRK